MSRRLSTNLSDIELDEGTVGSATKGSSDRSHRTSAPVPGRVRFRLGLSATTSSLNYMVQSEATTSHTLD